MNMVTRTKERSGKREFQQSGVSVWPGTQYYSRSADYKRNKKGE